MNALLSTSDAARLLTISPRYVQRLVQRGELRPVRLGRRVAFFEADVEHYARAKQDAEKADAGEERVRDIEENPKAKGAA